jgi:hypothetical protein
VRLTLKIVAWLLGGLLGIALVVLGINATDEPLSSDAQALLRRPPPPAPTEANAFIDFLALGAPADAPTYATGVAQLAVLNGRSDARLIEVKFDPQSLLCKYGRYLSCVAANAAPARAKLDTHAIHLGRYLAMRGKPQFVDLYAPVSPDNELPSYFLMTSGHRLVLTRAAIAFNAGQRAAALADLEAELAFYRRMASGSRSLLPKLLDL